MEQKQEQDNDEEEEYEVEELVTTTQKKKKQSKDDFTLKLRRKKSEWVEDRQEQSKEFSHDLDGDEYMEPMHLRTVNSIFRDIGAEQSDDDDEEEMVTTIQKTKKKKKKQKIMDEFDDVKRPLRKYNSQVILPSKQPFDFASYKKKIVKKKKKKIIQDGTKDKQTIGSETSVKQENDSNFEFDDGSSEFSDADSLNEFSFPSRSPSQSREMSPGSQKRRDAQIKQLQEQLKNETNKGKSQYNLTNDDLKTIFGPTGIILSVHKPFLDELKRSIQENGGKDIGQVLMKLAGCLSCYKPYITSGLTQAQQRLQQKQKDNKKLDKLIQSIPSVEGSQQNNIDIIQLQDLYVEGDQQDEIQEDDEVLQFDPRAILTPSRRLIMEFAVKSAEQDLIYKKKLRTIKNQGCQIFRKVVDIPFKQQKAMRILNPSGFTGQLMSKTDEEIQSMCLVGREYILQGTMHDIIQLEKQMKQAKDWKVIHTSQF
ncbi:MAG: hypothetical protein EZS28_012062 [Streblomastix strix]|uniref:DH domain-containing protein n=1 Tax=Streblomastix strix TaxID=222440 RepID=A0A5J4WDJ6_9EUKA|nr:MAG: hypothetical protein EZS28_012062 [Streblomastix strix]